jgi:4'-phosphopantetheinyl transferase
MTVEFLPHPSGPRSPGLPPSQVELWTWWLDRPGSETIALSDALAPDEAMRAAAYQAHTDRARFTAAHAFRRAILARYCHQPPASLRFIPGQHGKPALAGAQIHFSAARSAAVAMLAVSAACAVGADIEHLAMPQDAAAVLRSHASPAEIRAYFSLQEPARPQAFFRWWTSKEAVVKALGAGLTLPLSGFDVALDPSRPALLRSRLDVLQGPWTLLDLAPYRGYIGALAMQGAARPICAWRLDSFADALGEDPELVAG